MTFPVTKILLASEGSEDAALAARAAIDIVQKAGAELHVVHAWHSMQSTHFESYVRSQLEQEAQESLDGQVERIEDEGGEVAEAHLREGSAADEILDLAEGIGADLIVIGSRGLGPVKRIALGSVSEAVVHHATRPVLVLRGGWPPEWVVIGDDGLEAAESAGTLATFVGGLFGIKALLMRTYPELPEIDVEGRKFNPRLVDDELRREWRKLDDRAARIGKASGDRPAVRLSVGDPAACLLEVAEEEGAPEKTLIAVGSRGLGTMRRMRLGSVSTKVLRAAKGPVLIHLRPADTEGGQEAT
jgi:nucleotide-binding universal stress UspA family protein